MRPFRHESGIFLELSNRIVGPLADLSGLRLDHSPELLRQARAVWCDRARTELRSIQIMTRFLGEVLGAGDPIEVYAGAADLVLDEIRHVRLTVALCEALGATPTLPDPIELRDPEAFLRAPMAERALHTAIAMLCVNETLSVAFVEDLRDRCDDPAISRVLEATVADEEGHQSFGWSYVSKALTRFPASTLESWRTLVEHTLEPHRRAAAPILERVDRQGLELAALPEQELAALGLFSPERQALVFRACLEKRLLPQLRALDLA